MELVKLNSLGSNYGTELELLLRRHGNCTHLLYCVSLIYELRLTNPTLSLSLSTSLLSSLDLRVLCPTTLLHKRNSS